jgi:ArsR family transcriptional regulator, arsenate/arsenite/antimonite-responsive transcriptional repressor
MTLKLNPADVFRALGDDHRLEMLDYVATGERENEPEGPGICSCHIQAHVGLAQPTVSHHMKMLVEAGLVIGEKRGKWVYYRLNREGFAAAQRIVGRYLTLASKPARAERRSATS